MRKGLGALAAVLLTPAAALAAGGHEVFSWFNLLGLHLPQYMLSAIMIAILLVAVSLLAFGGKKTDELVVPEPRFTLRNLLELILSFLVGLAEDIIGHKAKQYVPLLATCFIFILFMNLLGLIPGFVPPTDQMNITVGLAVVIFLSTHYFGVREHGIAYFKHFLGPVWWLSPLIFIIELIGHLARILSLSIRLFGNITGHELVLGILFLLAGAFFAPLPIMALGIFVALLQAFVFLLLSIIYFSGAMEHAH